MLRVLTLTAALAAFSAGSAFAGEQYVDETGYAVSGYDVVAYHSLKQNSYGTRQTAAVPGKASITAEYNGAKWAFSSTENRDKFKADPAKYAPQFDGHCAYGIAQGGKVPANPNLWRILDGKLYVNITPNVVGFWEKDVPGNIKSAGQKWVSLEGKGASSKKWTAIKANDGTYTTKAPVAN